MINRILTGTQPKADAKLLQDIEDAHVDPDPFDGGCPADVTPHTSIQAKLLEREKENRAMREEQDRKYDHALKELVAAAKAEGVRCAIAYFQRTGSSRTARELRLAHEHGDVIK